MMDIGLVPVAGGADLAEVGGDFVVVESKVDHNKNLIYCDKGDWKENPIICVGAINYIDDDKPQDLLNAISEQLTLDGMEVISVAMGANKVISTDAYYK